MNRRTTSLIVAVVAILLFAVLVPASAEQHPVQKYWADNYGISPPAPDGKFYSWGRLAKAQPDECYFGLGNPDNRASFDALYPGSIPFGPTCTYNGNTGKPKVNQAYLWGLTNWGSDLWFGTIANTLCQVIDGMAAEFTTTFSLQTNTLACEGALADPRPPRIFLYDTQKRQLLDMTNLVKNSGNPDDYNRLLHTVGLRSAGSIGNIVFLGGITGDVVGSGGVSVFAFNGRTRKFLGSVLFNGENGLPKYTNIRQWLVVEDQLYVGVATSTFDGTNIQTGGKILRWTGSLTKPFNFQIVGDLLGDPAYLARFRDRIYVTTWGGPPNTFGTMLYMSPSLGDNNKLTLASANKWASVWKLSDYEVEPSAGAMGGAVAAHDGWLYWTTMTPPGMQALQFQQLYGNAPSDYGFLGSYRPTVMLRGRFLDNPRKRQIQLVYGNKLLPKYVENGTTSACTNTGPTCEWKIVPNNMNGAQPLYGLSGYNNFFNSYTWWMTVYNGELFIGTFDWSYILFEALYDLASGSPIQINVDADFGGAPTISGVNAATIPIEVIEAARKFEGADLLRIHSPEDPAYVVSLSGLGNFSNYGVRNMLPLRDILYVGTANPFNLLTDPGNATYNGQLGGWELIGLKPTGEWHHHYDSDDNHDCDH